MNEMHIIYIWCHTFSLMHNQCVCVLKYGHTPLERWVHSHFHHLKICCSTVQNYPAIIENMLGTSRLQWRIEREFDVLFPVPFASDIFNGSLAWEWRKNFCQDASMHERTFMQLHQIRNKGFEEFMTPAKKILFFLPKVHFKCSFKCLTFDSWCHLIWSIHFCRLGFIKGSIKNWAPEGKIMWKNDSGVVEVRKILRNEVNI